MSRPRSTASYLIRVTAEDIETPCVGALTDNCPVARAVNGRLKPRYSASVGSGSFSLYHKPLLGLVYGDGELPARARRFIATYDRRTGPVHNRPFTNRRLRPFSFRLTLPRHVVAS